MKKLVLAMLLTVTGHLLFDMYHAEALADVKLGGGATTDLITDARNPVMGTASIEKAAARLSLSLGSEGTAQGNADLLARSKDGLYAGAGLFVERLGTVDETTTSSSSDTTVVNKKHDQGKHKGDKHVRAGTVVTNTASSMLGTITLGNEEFALAPSVVLGMQAKNGIYFESRVILGGEYGGRGQASLGLRF